MVFMFFFVNFWLLYVDMVVGSCWKDFLPIQTPTHRLLNVSSCFSMNGGIGHADHVLEISCLSDNPAGGGKGKGKAFGGKMAGGKGSIFSVWKPMFECLGQNTSWFLDFFGWGG